MDFERILGTGEVIPLLDGDSAYHLLRIRYAVERFPDLPTFDPGMNWPYGAACPWADGFDLLGAALARAAEGSARATARTSPPRCSRCSWAPRGVGDDGCPRAASRAAGPARPQGRAASPSRRG